MADISQSGSYPKIVKPPTKASWTKQLFDHWKRAWYFERLLVVLVLLVAPVVVIYTYELLVSGLALKGEASKVAATLRQIKERANELNTYGILEAMPGLHDQNGYMIRYESSEIATEQVMLPEGIAIAGSVRFDQQGVPERPTVLKLRCGLNQADVVVSAQGAVMVPQN